MTNLRKKRILIVDDIPHWRKLLSTLLVDYELKVTTSYTDAVSVIEQYEFDIAVLDLRLEDNNIFNVDGVDLLKKIRVTRPKTSVVILTGYRESVRDQILREYKPNAIIEKETFDNSEFRIIIQDLASK